MSAAQYFAELVASKSKRKKSVAEVFETEASCLIVKNPYGSGRLIITEKPVVIQSGDVYIVFTTDRPAVHNALYRLRDKRTRVLAISEDFAGWDELRELPRIPLI